MTVGFILRIYLGNRELDTGFRINWRVIYHTHFPEFFLNKKAILNFDVFPIYSIFAMRGVRRVFVTGSTYM